MTISWLDREAVIKRLGVKPQTLYAYASRGHIRVKRDPNDSRCSLYNADDIDQLLRVRARGRRPAAIAAGAMAWGEPTLATGISTAHRGRLYYRGMDAIELARTATLEDTAALLWQVKRPAFPAFHTEASSVYTALAAHITDTRHDCGGTSDEVGEASAIVGLIASVCGAAPGTDPIHARIAAGWGCRKTDADKLRRALVVMADHDLNASTFAARVAASTAASLPASLLAGLCTLSGSRHGGAGAALFKLIGKARHHGADTALNEHLLVHSDIPGFGHPLYPSGDPREASITEDLTIPGILLDLKNSIAKLTGLAPNCDFGLAALANTLSLPDDAPFKLFLMARSVGWCAHVMEQRSLPDLIRPRGRYIGPLPDTA